MSIENEGKNLPALRALLAAYKGCGLLVLKPLEYVSYSLILGIDFNKIISVGPSYLLNQADDPDKYLPLLATYIGFKAVGSITRVGITEVISRHYKIDLTLAKRFAAIPFFGDDLAITAQIGTSSSVKQILHRLPSIKSWLTPKNLNNF